MINGTAEKMSEAKSLNGSGTEESSDLSSALRL